MPKEWIDTLALPTQVSIKESKINYQHGFVLYKALANYLQNNKSKFLNIVEVGTGKGFSALCMAKAISDSDQKGLIQSIDILPHNVPIYWNSIKDHDGKLSRRQLLKDYYHLTEKYIQFNHGKSENVLPKLSKDRIHFAFIDGEHFYENVLFDGSQIANTQKKGDIIIYDDYTKSIFDGVVKAADEICDKYNYKKTMIKASDQRSYLIAEKK